MNWRVTPAERRKIDAAVAKWKIEPKRMSDEDLEAMKWLFESLMWEQEKSSIRLFMQQLYSHIAALEEEARASA